MRSRLSRTTRALALASVSLLALTPAIASAGAFDVFVSFVNSFWGAIFAVLGIVCMVSWSAVIGQYLASGQGGQVGGLFWAALGCALGSTLLLGVASIVAAINSGVGGGTTGTV